jgi:hypothetical protein
MRTALLTTLLASRNTKAIDRSVSELRGDREVSAEKEGPY